METVALRGGAWLFDEAADADVFTPEKLSEEHRLIARTTEEFLASEVLPHLERLESKDWAFSRHLIKRCGDLGLLGLAAPEEYGGLDLDKASALVVVEKVARSASFATTFGGQSNLCVLPLVLFGTAEQKALYLPPLIAGDIVGAYAAESLSYRTAGLIDAALGASGNDGASIAKAFEEFAIEASICKVAGTETLDFVLDENVQIHGGNGFVRDYMAERYFRDARVNRIFEGTNEINRLLIPGMLVRRGLKNELPLVPAARRLQDEILSLAPASGASGGEGPLASERRTMAAFKQVAVMVVGTALQTYGDALEGEQEVLSCAADILIETYASESATSRARQSRAAGLPHAGLHESATRVYVHDAAARVEASAKTALSAMADGDQLRTLLAALRRVLKPAPVNTVALRRELAEAVTARAGYIL